jgi:hypothetical protein
VQLRSTERNQSIDSNQVFESLSSESTLRERICVMLGVMDRNLRFDLHV